MSLERKIESSIFLCIPRDLNILGKSCTTFVIVKIVRNLSRGRSPCQRVNHVKSGVIYFSAFIFSYDTIHVSGTIHTWNRDLTITGTKHLGIVVAFAWSIPPIAFLIMQPIPICIVSQKTSPSMFALNKPRKQRTREGDGGPSIHVYSVVSR